MTRPLFGEIAARVIAWAAILVFVALKPAVSADQSAPVWYAPTGDPVGYAKVVEAVRAANVSILGEVHDNPDHHRAQADVLAALVADGRRPAVIWEMVDRDRQAAIDEAAAAGELTAETFPAVVAWSESGWPAWSMYQPIAEVAFAAGLPMIAGDLDRGGMKAVMSDGIGAALPGSAELWPIAQVYDEAAENAQLDAIFYGHCELVPRDKLRPMLSAQYGRDMSLALAVLDALEIHDSVVLITGNGHARRDIAVPMLLTYAHPDVKVASIGLRETNPSETAPRSIGLFDFIGETPGIARPDPCEGLREKFSATHQNN